MMYSAYKLSNQADNIQPWHIPFPIWNQSVVPCLVLTIASWPAYSFLKRQVLIAKFRLKLEKVGITTRPFRYDLNQIPYDYTVEVRNRFKGLDLIDREPDELWWTMDRGSWHCTGDRDQDHPHGKEMQKGKMVVWGGLTSWLLGSLKLRVMNQVSIKNCNLLSTKRKIPTFMGWLYNPWLATGYGHLNLKVPLCWEQLNHTKIINLCA